MAKKESKLQTEISKVVFESLKTFRRDGGFVQVDIQDMGQYNQLKELSEQGYLVKNAKEFSITELGLSLLEDIENYVEDEKLENIDESQYEVKYNLHENIRNVAGDGSFQALDASYPIDERFWPSWLKEEVEKFNKFKK